MLDLVFMHVSVVSVVSMLLPCNTIVLEVVSLIGRILEADLNA